MALQILLALHVLGAAIWLGGLLFVAWILPLSLGREDNETCHACWVSVLRRFFPWVWGCIIVVLGSGFVMISLLGGFTSADASVYFMMTMGIVMTALFKFTYVAPFKHLVRGVEEGKPEVASYALGTIRKLALTNLLLGVAALLAAMI